MSAGTLTALEVKLHKLSYPINIARNTTWRPSLAGKLFITHWTLYFFFICKLIISNKIIPCAHANSASYPQLNLQEAQLLLGDRATRKHAKDS